MRARIASSRAAGSPHASAARIARSTAAVAPSIRPVRSSSAARCASTRAPGPLAGRRAGHDRRVRGRQPRTFTAHEIAPAGDGWAVQGALHVRDRTVGVRLAAQVVALEGDGYRVRATTSIDRRDAGITAPAS